MAEVQKQHLLNAEQMARFVCDGFLLLEGLVPQDYNERALEEEKAFPNGGYDFWERSPNVQSVFELPQVKGILQSLVGRNPVYDHSYIHVVPAGGRRAQAWHQDSIIDVRPCAFDIQAFYFSHDTPLEMGPTLVLPGSHLRRINTFNIGRYKNILGQRQLACKAGSIAFVHHGIWHCAQPNRTDTARYVFKLRLRPGEPQQRLFNMDGYDSPEIRALINHAYQPWQGNEDRLDHVQRAKLWRYVTGDDSVDVSFENALTRMGI